MQNEHMKESSELSIRLQQDLTSKTGAKDRGVMQANFYVLRGVFMPAVLIEMGYISNEKEEGNLVSKAYQEKVVAAIVSGVKSFKLKFDYLW
jgi:N-acetylmuramoyl-L-alanine amidase